MALAQLPNYIIRFPLVTPPVRSAEVILPSLLPAAPALEVGANVAVCLAGAAELGVDVAGPSLTVCPLVATMVVLFRSGFRLCLSLYRHDAGLTLGST